MNVKIIGTVLGGLMIPAGAQDDPNPTPPQQGPTVGLSDLKPVRSTDAAQVTRRVAPETQKKQSLDTFGPYFLSLPINGHFLFCGKTVLC